MSKRSSQQLNIEPLVSPVANAVRHQIRSNRRQILATALLTSAIAMPQQAAAQSDSQGLVLEEIVVTAQKREQNLQDVPISITALGAETLEELGITDFESYAQMLPNLSYKSIGPGTATLIMRGASDGGDGNASGSQPSVGLYLDESPVTTIASNLDIHIYDIERIESLGGPQGTLYGASSQSGNLKIITNKPNTEEFSAGIDVGGFGTTGGDPSYSLEGFANIPMGDKAAIRLVGWVIEDGGYIDNIAGTRNYTLEGGYGYNPLDPGTQNPTFPDSDPGGPYGRTSSLSNDALVDDNFNDLSKVGGRAALRVNLNDNWTVDASVIFQNLQTDGTWDHDPANAGERNIQRWFEDFSEDDFTQGNLTVQGEIGNSLLTYSGTIMDRDVQYQSDYTAYGEDAYWVPYYVCDYTATGADIATESASDCTSLAEYYQEDNDYGRDTHELRLQSIGDSRFQYTVGAYFTEVTHKYLQEWVQPGISQFQAVPDGADNVFFRTRQDRADEQTALFAEVTVDVTDAFSLTAGVRYFENESTLAGVVGWGPNLFFVNDTGVDASYSDEDTIGKLNATWRINDDFMIYATLSEGYRPGGLNRDPGLIAIGEFEYQPDILTNLEFGWKSDLADGRVRWNGAIYRADWEDIQYTIYQFSLSACCGSVYNLADAVIIGLETDITAILTDNWTLSAALALNSGETVGDFILPSGLLAVPDGTELPNVPEVKANVSTRYDFQMGGLDAYWQIVYSYTGESYNEIRPSSRVKQDSYGILNLRAGIDKESWGVDLFVNNATDEVAQIYVSPRPYEPSITTNRPMTYGAKLWTRF